MISKELFRKVMNFDGEIGTLEIDKEYPTFINYSSHLGRDIYSGEINIYELAHKCKEWAFEQGVEVVTYKRAYQTYRALPKGLKDIQTPEITEDSEPEAVFEACQFVLDHKMIKEEE